MNVKEWSLHLACRMARCRIQDTIVVAGTERSGTTWLFEMLSNLEGYRSLYEPLVGNKQAFESGFGKRNTIKPGEQPQPQTRYMREILKGIVGTPSCWRFESSNPLPRLQGLFSNRKLVVKFVRANRMLRWLAETFQPKGILFIVRHPCAVVASMRGFSRFCTDELCRDLGENPVHQAVQEEVTNKLRARYGSVLSSVESYEEILAALWCVDHVVPFHQQGDEEAYPWKIVPYEKLTLEPRPVLEEMSEYVGLNIREKARGTIRDQSSSVWEGRTLPPEEQVRKWKKKLSTQQIDRILSVVSEFDLDDIYDDRPEPDYNALYQYSSSTR